MHEQQLMNVSGGGISLYCAGKCREHREFFTQYPTTVQMSPPHCPTYPLKCSLNIDAYTPVTDGSEVAHLHLHAQRITNHAVTTRALREHQRQLCATHTRKYFIDVPIGMRCSSWALMRPSPGLKSIAPTAAGEPVTITCLQENQ